MRDYIAIGPSPIRENCVQVGSDNYSQKARKECSAFVKQLRRQFGDEPVGANLAVRANAHDFGTYYEVVCYYEDDYPQAVDYALRCEGDTPERWDEEAVAELTAAGYPLKIH